MNTFLAPSTVRPRACAVEIAPDLDWLDRVTGRAAVDPTYREQLLSRPAAALIGESLPVGLFVELGKIRARDLSEYARLAIEIEAAYRQILRAADLDECVDLAVSTGAGLVGAAA